MLHENLSLLPATLVLAPKNGVMAAELGEAKDVPDHECEVCIWFKLAADPSALRCKGKKSRCKLQQLTDEWGF